MRLALPAGVPLTFPLRLRIPLPTQGQAAVLGLFLLAFQPLGSPVALALFSCALGLLLMLSPLPARPLGNWTAVLGCFAAALAGSAALGGVNLALFLLYAGYWTGLVAGGLVLSQEISRWRRRDVLAMANWLLALDLLANVGPVLLELAVHGIGDYVTGLSGVTMGESLSQNRTNALRAGCIAVLAAANWGAQRNGLSLASLGFNGAVVLLSVSITTIASGLGAIVAVVVLRGRPLQTIAACATLVGLAVAANELNKMNGSADIFEFLSRIDTQWLPKLDIYRQYGAEMVARYPWMPWIGLGMGNFMNRFALLANFQGLSSFPGKEALSELLKSPPTQYHLVEYYDLENGVVGNSIVSTPWSSLGTFLFEWGLLGMLLAAAVAWPFLRRLWGAGNPKSMVGTGKFLIFFLGFNLFFDCYLDYPEVMVPFLIVALLLMELGGGKVATFRARASR